MSRSMTQAKKWFPKILTLGFVVILAVSGFPAFRVSAPSGTEQSRNNLYNFWIGDGKLFLQLGTQVSERVISEYTIRSAKVLDYEGFHIVLEDISDRTPKTYYLKLADDLKVVQKLELLGGYPEVGIADGEVYVITKSLIAEHIYRSKDLGNSFIEIASLSKSLEYGIEIKKIDNNILIKDSTGTVNPSAAEPKALKATANWTFMVYLDGDCDLEDAAIDDFNEMAVAGSTSEANIIVQFDRISGYDTTNGDWTTCKRFRITQGMTPTAANQLSDIGEVNIGDPNVLIDFVKWGIQTYPAKYYMVTCWDHGGGWKGGVCIDSTSSDRLYPSELKYAFEEIRKFLGRPLDIVGYDACLMAESAIYYEHWHTADYIVASEETEGWDGWIYGQQPADSDSNYPGICEALKQWPNMTPPEFGRVIVERNIVTPSIDTLSCIDSEKFNYPAAEQFQNLSQKLRHVTNTYNSQIGTARTNAQAFYYSYMKDIWHLAKLLKDNVPDSEVKDAAQKFMDAYNLSVVKNGNVGGSYANAYGLTVYFDSSYDSGYDALSIAKENRWDEFLKAYFANTNYPNEEPVCAVTEPAQGSTVYQTAPITIKGTASDPVEGSTIQSVQVKIDREFWLNATGTNPWQLTWNPANATEGVHKIFARSFDGNDFSPWAVCEVYVAVDPNLPDLTVTDIAFSSATPYEGDIITINATVKNVGINWSANNVNVSFYSGDPKAGGAIINTVNVGNIVIGGSKLASTSWNTTGFVGLNNIYVKADSTDTIAETNELNNTANKTITVGGYRVELSCPTNKSKVRAGMTATYNIQVKNLGTFTDTIILSLTNTNVSWTANLSTSSVSLAPYSETTIYLDVTAPSDALPDANVTVYVKGTSQGDIKKNSTISTLTTVIPKILLVDDESGTDETFYKSALDAKGYKYDYTAPEQITGWSSVLMQYKVVIWFTAGTATLSDFDKQNLQFYLDGGGLLLICGEDIGYDIAGDADKFYQNYLHASYILDNSGVTTITGIAGDPISDGFSNLPVTGSYPSEIAPYDSYATATFKYGATTKVAAIKVDTGVYKLVYIACEYFEGTDTSANKATIMDRIIKWLEPVNDVLVKSIDYPADGGKYSVGVNYINATVINNGKNAQSNFNVSCKIEEVIQPTQTTTATTTIFSDSFEVDLSKWTITPAGKWVRNTTYANSGSYSAKCLYDNNNTDYNLTSQNIDLSGATNAKFEYYFRGSSENNYDFLYVEIKRSTETTWSMLKSYANETAYNTSWNYVSIDISNYAGSVIQTRFRFHTDGSILRGIGWYVDDVAVSTTFSDGFEVDLSKWTVTPSGKWVRSTTYANSGSYSVNALYDANYVDYNLTSGNIDLSGATNANFEYYFRGSSENNYDYLYVEIKRATETSWTTLTKYCGTTYNTSWNKGSLDISGYAGSTIQVRFRFHTDSSNYGGSYGIGWYVDDVAVSKTIPPVTQVVFNNNQTVTTSLAQYATKSVSWSYNFLNATDYIITVKTWLGTDESKGNDAKSITVIIVLMFAFSFEQGWNYISLPLNTSYKYAGALANDISTCTHVRKWDSTTQSWMTYEKATGINNFTLENGIGYWVYTTSATEFTTEGAKISTQTMSLTPGWSSIGRFNETLIYASDLANSIGSNCTSIAYWDCDQQRFITYIVGTQIGNFKIERGLGYMVYVVQVTPWKNE